MTTAEEQSIDVAAVQERLRGKGLMGDDKPPISDTAAATALGRLRKRRSDAGKPRIFVDAPGVRFDLMHLEGRTAFKYWIAHVYVEGGAVFGNAAVDQLLRHIESLTAGA